MEKVNKSFSYGDCRCCLAKGKHRNVMKEYFYNGTREVYIEIFMECLNLFLSTDTSVSPLICSKCVQRLRDACSFRAMVADTERHLLDLVSKKKQETIFVNVQTEDTVKAETTVKVEELSEDEDPEVVCDTDFLSADDLIETVQEPLSSSEELVEGEAALLARFPRSLPPLPARAALYNTCPGFVKHLDKLKNLIFTSDMIPTLQLQAQKKTSHKSVFVSEKLAHITNATTLLQYSNLTPFRSKGRTGFPCFYCRHMFEEFDRLREHARGHKTMEILRVLKQCGPESLVVYAEVTDLMCNICNQAIPNINELKSHLTKVHAKKMYPEVSDRVIPFKVKGNLCECQICGCNFETFGAAERHMNGHYRNYVCKDCGTGFITKYRLKVHCKSMHVDGTFPCEFCGKIFSTYQKHKNHVNAVHKMIKRFKCVKCPQRFAEYFRRQKHMESVHGVTPLKYKCNVCDRAFDRRYTLSRHLKRDHLEERDYQCEVCAYKCFTKNELKVHMIKHNGERIFECSVCKKSYARKKTLKEHMRIHNNDRRFVCAVCGQAFVQKCSLKGHLKTQHLEYNVH